MYSSIFMRSAQPAILQYLIKSSQVFRGAWTTCHKWRRYLDIEAGAELPHRTSVKLSFLDFTHGCPAHQTAIVVFTVPNEVKIVWKPSLKMATYKRGAILRAAWWEIEPVNLDQKGEPPHCFCKMWHAAWCDAYYEYRELWRHLSPL